MADKKISQLINASPLTGDEFIALVQPAIDPKSNTKVTINEILGLAPVQSVNGFIGDVVLTAHDIGALAAGDNISLLTNDIGYLTTLTGAWLAASGVTLTGPNIIIGSTSNTLKYQFQSLGVTQTNGAGIWLQNSTLASAGAQQISPSLVLEGQGWKTQATAGSQSVKFAQYIIPAQGIVNPTGTWFLDSSINNGSYNHTLSVNATGIVSALGGNASFLVGNTVLSNTSLRSSGLNDLVLQSDSGSLRLNDTSQTGGISIGNISTPALNVTAAVCNLNVPSILPVQTVTTITMDGVIATSFSIENGVFASTDLYQSVVQTSGLYWVATKDDLSYTLTLTMDLTHGLDYVGDASHHFNIQGGALAKYDADRSFSYDDLTLVNKGYVLGAKTFTGKQTFAATWEIGTLGYSDTGILFSAQSSTNSYNQAILQNTSAGATASTNFNASNDQGTATTNFGEFGINSSGFTGSGAFSTAGYVYLAAATTDLAIGTYAANGIHFVINSGATDAMTISSKQNFSFNQLAQSSSWSSALTFTPGAHTAYTAATEFIDYNFVGRSVTWLDGTTSRQRFFYFGGNTVNKTTTSAVFTDIFNTYFEPSIAGSGVTFSRNWASGFNGNVYINTRLLLSNVLTGFLINEQLQIRTDTNAFVGAVISNGTNGTGSEAGFQLRSNSSQIMNFGMKATGFTTSGINVAASGVISVNAALNIGCSSASSLGLWTNNTQRVTIDSLGNVVVAQGALATNATDGFLYITTGAGAPTGIPTAKTGTVPMYYDTTNNFLYFYNGGWKKSTVYA